MAESYASSWHEERLSKQEKHMYDKEAAFLRRILASKKTSGGISTRYKYKLPKKYIVKGTSSQVSARVGRMSDDVTALLSRNHPELMPWSYGEQVSTEFSYSGTKTYQCRSITISVTASYPYRLRPDDPYTLDASRLQGIKRALHTADSVVRQFSSLSDYQKIKAYADWISDHVSYNWSVYGAADSYKTDYRPYEMIYVFDADPDTNVVCQGYARAFQYLMDRSLFSDKTVRSRIVSSDTHAWNVVTIGGKNYFVDVTWYDGDKDFRTDGFLLGSQETLDRLKTGTYQIKAGGTTWRYPASDDHEYSRSTRDFYTADELVLSDKPFVPAAVGVQSK